MDSTDIFSKDNFVEFGMGIAIANQMASSMNHTMRQTEFSRAGESIPVSNNNIYYAVLNNKQSGPYSLSEISSLISEKRVVKETYIWKPGMANWDLAENIDELLNIITLMPPPTPIE